MKAQLSSIEYTLNHRSAMETHVSNCYPDEACGFLAGSRGKVSMVVPITNILHSDSGFYMDPQEQINALYLIEKNYLKLLSIYHSHPYGPVFPSPMDIDQHINSQCVLIIWSFLDNQWDENVFRLNGYGFEKINKFII